MLKAYQFRLNPSHHQRTLLLKTLDACRWVYNKTLAMRKNAWAQEQQSFSLYETNKLLPGWKVEKPELGEVHSQVLQNVQARVDLAFQAFFRRVKAGATPGYPRFRGRGRYDSLRSNKVASRFVRRSCSFRRLVRSKSSCTGLWKGR